MRRSRDAMVYHHHRDKTATMRVTNSYRGDNLTWEWSWVRFPHTPTFFDYNW